MDQTRKSRREEQQMKIKQRVMLEKQQEAEIRRQRDAMLQVCLKKDNTKENIDIKGAAEGNTIDVKKENKKQWKGFTGKF